MGIYPVNGYTFIHDLMEHGYLQFGKYLPAVLMAVPAPEPKLIICQRLGLTVYIKADTLPAGAQVIHP